MALLWGFELCVLESGELRSHICPLGFSATHSDSLILVARASLGMACAWSSHQEIQARDKLPFRVGTT